MYAYGTCQLGYTCYRQLDLLACCHDKVAELIYYHHDVWHELVTLLWIKLMVEVFLVILLDIPRSSSLEQVITMVHQCTQRLQCPYNLCDICYDRILIFVHHSHEMVGNRPVDRELHLLWVDKDNLELIRVFLIEKGCYDGVKPDRFSLTCGTCHK